MPDPLAAFPTRPVHARPPGSLREEVWAFLGALMFAGILVASAIWIAPTLWTDFRIRDTAVPIQGAHLTNGKCDTKAFIDICDVTLTAPGPNGPIVRSVHYLFVSLQGNFRARVVADPAYPEWLSTDLGLDYFWNRALTLLVVAVLMAGFVLFFIRTRYRAWRNKTSWRTRPMVPVPLELMEAVKDRSGAHWTVRSETGATQRWTMPRKSKPFVLGPDSRILGLSSRGGDAVMPLDDRLRWVDLTNAERQAVLGAR